MSPHASVRIDDDESNTYRALDQRSVPTVRITKNTQLSIPVITILIVLIVGFAAWLWFIHQRTDAIPAMQQKLENVDQGVRRIEDLLLEKALRP